MSPGAEGGVFGLAERIPHYSNASPVIDGILQALVRGETAFDLQALALAPRHRCDAAQTSQGVIGFAPRRFVGLGKQRGQDRPADTGK